MYTIANATLSMPQVVLFGTSGCSTSQFNVPPTPGGLVGWQPGPSDERPQLQLPLPSSGTVRIVASAFALDVAGCGGVGATTDVHAFVDGVQVWSGDVAVGSSPTTDVTIAVSAGSIVLFSIGDGGNGYFCDLTSLVATVTYMGDPVTCRGSILAPSLQPAHSASESSSAMPVTDSEEHDGGLRRLRAM